MDIFFPLPWKTLFCLFTWQKSKKVNTPQLYKKTDMWLYLQEADRNHQTAVDVLNDSLCFTGSRQKSPVSCWHVEWLLMFYRKQTEITSQLLMFWMTPLRKRSSMEQYYKVGWTSLMPRLKHRRRSCLTYCRPFNNLSIALRDSVLASPSLFWISSCRVVLISSYRDLIKWFSTLFWDFYDIELKPYWILTHLMSHLVLIWKMQILEINKYSHSVTWIKKV